MADQLKRKWMTFFRIANICFVLVLAYSILGISSFLLAKQTICSTTVTGIYFSIAFSIATILTAGLRCYLIFRQRHKLQTISPSPALPRLDSTCAAAVKCLVALWMILVGCSLLPVALRAPVCLPQPLPQWQDDLVENNWRYGLSCRLHRTVVGLSVVMAVSICAVPFFDNVGRGDRRRGSTYIGCYWRVARREPKHRGAVPSLSSSLSTSEVDKRDGVFLVPDKRPSRLEHEQWLQRRYSLSSQRAIYPHKYHYYDPRSRYVAYSYAPSSRYPSTLHSVSEGRCLDNVDDGKSSVLLGSSQPYGSLATVSRPSTVAASRGRSSSSPEKSGRRTSHASAPVQAIPDVPALPALPAPTWSPALQHTPLSADPTIRALAMGMVPGQPHPQPQPQPKPKSRPRAHDAKAATLPSVNDEAATPRSANANAGANVLGEVDGNVRPPKTPVPTSGGPPLQKSAPPQPPTLPPPPPPPAATTGSKLATLPVPHLPTRSPDHFVSSQTKPASASPNTRPSLRHTSTPARYRLYYNTPYASRGTSSHHGKGDASVSMYSASSSSYGSDRTAGSIGRDTRVRQM